MNNDNVSENYNSIEQCPKCKSFCIEVELDNKSQPTKCTLCGFKGLNKDFLHKGIDGIHSENIKEKEINSFNKNFK